ncbi:MAG TPA: nitrilase-related carbon-nitrogen hydrolase, partial [Steroidobacteraceae bacterium]|nr:nitrilase-related carbon-nitrogen hydrolase [Steroidobacteraceae bacterium]
FDVDLPGRSERYRESATTLPGAEPVVVDTPIGMLGLSVCYDLRFPEHYRQLAALGATVLAVPAAFTAPTGRAHWEVLLRARAIENQCHVLAAAQSGLHDNGRETYGDSMIVEPWGSVQRRLPRGSGFVAVQIDSAVTQALRKTFPVLAHRRPPA